MREAPTPERGRAALAAGDFATARQVYAPLTEQHPDDVSGWFFLGAAEHGLGQLEAARRAFANATRLQPGHLQSHLALAAVCSQLGDHAAAKQACQQAVRIAPGNPQAWANLAVAQDDQGCTDEALTSCQEALRIAPDFADALKNRGVLLQKLGRFAEAVASNQEFSKRFPARPDAYFNLGESCLAAGLPKQAADAFADVLKITPDHVKAMLHAGYALALCERFTEAQCWLDAAARRDPQQVLAYRRVIFGPANRATNSRASLDARTLFILFHYDRVERGDWDAQATLRKRFSDWLADPAPGLDEPALGFRALALGMDPAGQKKLAERIANGILRDAGIAPTQATPTPRTTADGALAGAAPTGTNKMRRLRIGYLSPDFRNHASGQLAQALYGEHDRAQFEVFGYALGGDDGSAVRQRIAEGCDHFVDLDALDDAAAAERIRADRIDLLIDLIGYGDRSRPAIAARRPAPVQLTWLDYMATSGAPWIDYRISDARSIPSAHASDFSEAIIRLPGGLYPCNYALHRPPPAPPRAACGLPGDGRLLGALHRAFKIDRPTFLLWMRLLQTHPDTHLVLLDNGTEATGRWRAFAGEQGVDPTRLVTLPKCAHNAHLIRLQHLDLLLDTPACSGGATTADALAAGIPVLTCCGRTLAQRMSASLMAAANLSDLITTDLTQYEYLARQLLGTADGLGAVRQKLQSARRSAPFFQPTSWVRGLERGLQAAWQRHCAHLPPADIDIEDEPAS